MNMKNKFIMDQATNHSCTECLKYRSESSDDEDTLSNASTDSTNLTDSTVSTDVTMSDIESDA